uniref:Myb-like domain-containing protein n=1 Tax=Auxenochlorella protothecoides TaxID=3075 RepID=A0A1D2A5Z9_AUXPR
MCGTVVNDPGASCISCSVGACPLLFCSLCETLSHAESVSRPLLVPSFYLFAGPASGPRAKKAKVQADTAEAQTPGPAAPADTPAPDSAPPTTPGGAWTAAQDLELQRLVREEGYRKEVLGKKHLKWSRIAEHFGHSKKSSRKRFTALTGEPAPE